MVIADHMWCSDDGHGTSVPGLRGNHARDPKDQLVQDRVVDERRGALMIRSPRRMPKYPFVIFVDTPQFSRKLRAPMNHQLITFCTRQRSALKVCAGNLVNSRG